MTLQIDDLRDPGILRHLNNAAVPDVNLLDDDKAEWLVSHAALARVATIDGNAAGVIIVLGDSSDLASEYFTWFTERYNGFVYIDRVIVADSARRHGVATSLYREVDRLADEGGWAIASDVYCEPPNVASLRFHHKMGYREIGQQLSHLEGKTVSKLMKFGERARRVG